MEHQSLLDELSRIAGAPVLAAERCGWGFENETLLATLAGGRRVIIQRLAPRAALGRALRLAQQLPARLARVGIRSPQQLAADAAATPPFAVREYLPGDPGATLMGALPGARVVARAMGALLPLLAGLPTDGLDLDKTWAAPAPLMHAAKLWLGRCQAHLDAAEIAIVAGTIAELPAHFAERPAVFAHGDFCPVNVLVERRDAASLDAGLAVVGLIDLEFTRLADALFDAAWWGWVVRFHHYERWLAAWPELLAAAGLPNDQATAARVLALQRLRCLEMLDYQLHDRAAPTSTDWAERLRVTLRWE